MKYRSRLCETMFAVVAEEVEIVKLCAENVPVPDSSDRASEARAITYNGSDPSVISASSMRLR